MSDSSLTSRCLLWYCHVTSVGNATNGQTTTPVQLINECSVVLCHSRITCKHYNIVGLAQKEKKHIQPTSKTTCSATVVRDMQDLSSGLYLISV